MVRVQLAKPEKVFDSVIREIFDWVTQMEGSVPNCFYVETNFPEFFKANLGATRSSGRLNLALQTDYAHRYM